MDPQTTDFLKLTFIPFGNSCKPAEIFVSSVHSYQLFEVTRGKISLNIFHSGKLQRQTTTNTLLFHFIVELNLN